MSYADMVTLLFALFLVLFASSAESGQLQKVMVEVQAAVAVASPSPTPVPTPAVVLESPREGLKTRLQAALGEDLGNIASVHEERRGVVVAVLDSPMLFDSGSTRLKPQAQAMLARVTKVAQPLPHQIRVEGHTDNVPVGNSGYRSNWELSVLRASAVAEASIQGGLDAERVSVMGYGDTHPLYSNANETDRARNRRVEIVFLDPPGTAPAAEPTVLAPLPPTAPEQWLMQNFPAPH